MPPKIKRKTEKLPRTGSFLNELNRLSSVKAGILLSIFLMWFIAVPNNNKYIGIIVGSLFTLVEFTWTTLVDEKENGELIYFKSFIKNKKFGHSTPEQWFVNILLLPVILPYYYLLINNKLYRILFSCILIWVIEIIEGYFLIYIFGYNRAWHYYGSDAYFHGNIKLRYAPFWILLGFFIEFIVNPLLHLDQMKSVF